jgi:PAS domain S-box-containing protein
MQNVLLNLVMASFLFLLFASLSRGRREWRLRFWVAGYLLLLIDAMLPLWDPRAHFTVIDQTVVHLDIVTLLGICFLLAMLEPPASPWPFILSLALPALLLVNLTILEPTARGWILLIVIASTAVALVQARRSLAAQPLRRHVTLAIVTLTAVVMLITVRRAPAFLPRELLSELYLLNAFFFWTSNLYTHREGQLPPPPRTAGIVTASLGMLLWAIIGPLGLVIPTIFPGVVLSQAIWNIPKFFVAFGMILIIHEEDTALAQSLSEKYRLLFDRHPLPMWVFDAKTLQFLTVNDAAIQSYGYTREEFAQMTLEDIRPPEDMPRVKQALLSPPDDLAVSPGWRHLRKDGTMIDVDSFWHSIEYDGQPAYIGVVIDVTKRNAAEQQLRQAYKLESLGQLTGGVAHDFNNILAIILGNLEMIGRNPIDRPTRDLLKQAVASVDRGAALTSRLLAYARQQPLDPHVVDIARLIQETSRFIKSSLGPTVHIHVLTAEGLWNSEIDSSQLENALLNLGINSRDAMPRGGDLTIKATNLHLSEDAHGLLGEIDAGDYILIEVTDTGVGMPEEILSRATEPFFTTKPVGKGTGLGLSMVYGFLKQSGGHLRIHSKPGVGTNILLYLPRTQSSSQPTPPPEVVVNRTFPRGQETVLVVEDEAPIRMVIVTLLRSLGYSVHEAEDGPAALIHLQNAGEIDLLLTDVVLPNGISGALLATDARITHPGIRVLYSSGYTRNALTRDRRLEEGVHLLTKPFRLEDLAVSVRNVLDHATIAP